MIVDQHLFDMPLRYKGGVSEVGWRIRGEEGDGEDIPNYL